MCSIRELCLVASIVVCGCQPAFVSRPAELNPVPVVEDEAMRLRQWPQSSARYPSGKTVAGPTLFACEPAWDQQAWRYYYADTGVFLGNFFMLPIRAFTEPLNSQRIYPGEVVVPSHTAMPALPPEVIQPPRSGETTQAGPAADVPSTVEPQSPQVPAPSDSPVAPQVSPPPEPPPAPPPSEPPAMPTPSDAPVPGQPAPSEVPPADTPQAPQPSHPADPPRPA